MTDAPHFGDARLPDRFWQKVEIAASGCWRWTAGLSTSGYGRFGASHSRVEYAHRTAWTALVGPIPAGRMLDHICRERTCVNPAHLHVVTAKQNQEHRAATTRSHSGRRGVSWAPHVGMWRVRVFHAGRTHDGGYHRELADADRAAVDLRNRLYTNNLLDRSAS